MPLKPKTKPELKHLDHFILRTPLLSLKHASAAPTKLNNRFEAGLLLASQAFWQQEQRYDSLNDAGKAKLDRSRFKYWLRASTRPTPYGTFAGIALGAIDREPSKLILAETDHHRVALRLDMQVLAKIIAQIQSDPAIREYLTYTVNNSLYRVPGGYRYAEWRLKDGARNYHLAEIAGTDTLDRIIDISKKPVELLQLRSIILDETESSTEEIDSFLNELIDSQILISNLETCITGPDPLTELIRKLSFIPDASKVRNALENIQQLIREPKCSVEQIQRISEVLEKTEFVKDDDQTLLQADTYLNCSKAHLNEDILSKILQQIQSLLALGQPTKISDLEDFKKHFSERYEGQSVPLSIALDTDLGIGYGAVNDHSAGHHPLIDGLIISPQKGHRSITQTPLAELALKKYEEWNTNGRLEINLTDEDFSDIAQLQQTAKWPASMFVMGSLLGSNEQFDVDTFQFDVSVVTGPSAANLLGRFTHGDNAILNFARDIINKEQDQYPRCILAEIAHCAQERTGNIQFRPLLRPFEIPYVGLSGLPEEHQIPVDDLLLRMDGTELFLWSKKHDQRVIPRLSTAHNFSAGSLPVYKFLCDLQRQHTLSLPLWDWGLLDSAKHLPRVIYKNLILKKARWIVDEKDVHSNELLKWKTERKAPDRVVHTEGDNELLIDFSNEKGQVLFLHLIRKHKRLLLEEFIFTEENAVVKNRAGDGFTNELIIPFSVKATQIIPPKNFDFNHQSVQHKFLPGSEWMYFKIYCGTKSAENILINTILPFVRNGEENKRFEKFFFIRYHDDAAHLRVRFYCPDQAQRHKLTETFRQTIEPLVNNGTVSKLCQDTYMREIERYGLETIEAAESLFHNDSLAVLQFLELLNECGDESYRMLIALRSTDMLLDDFELTLSQKQKLLSSLQQAYFQEFGGSAELQKSLNSRYREWQSRIALHMNECNDEANEIVEAVDIFRNRSEQNEEIIDLIKASNSIEKWMIELCSYMHMNLNRFFISEQRKNELIVYHFLEKYYSSELAREAANRKIEMING